MSRSAVRWLVFAILLAAVTALGFYNSASNARLIQGISAGERASLDEFSTRQDAYIFLQSESPNIRLAVARHLGSYTGSKAVELVLKLIPDPDPNVRAALISSLTVIATRNPELVAKSFSASGASESAALIEASAADPRKGIEILKSALAQNEGSQNAFLLAKRIGPIAKLIMIDLLKSKTESTFVSALEVLSTMSISTADEDLVAQKTMDRFEASKSQQFKDRLLPYLANYAPPRALGIFRSTAFDKIAPSNLRAVCASALRRLGDQDTLRKLSEDADPAVAAAAR